MTFPASGWFGPTIEDMYLNDSAVDLLADTVRVALFLNSMTTPDYDTNTAYGIAPWSGAAEVANGSGYTTGGVVLANKTFALASPSDGLYKYDGDDVQWLASTFTARGCLIYDDTTADLGIAGITFGADLAVTAGTFAIAWAAAGILTGSYA